MTSQSVTSHDSDSELDRYTRLHTFTNTYVYWRLLTKDINVFFSLSDDDLTPYDMSADQEKKKSAPPRYVRDCLEGGLESKMTL